MLTNLNLSPPFKMYITYLFCYTKYCTVSCILLFVFAIVFPYGPWPYQNRPETTTQSRQSKQISFECLGYQYNLNHHDMFKREEFDHDPLRSHTEMCVFLMRLLWNTL